jgi:hypothetical protein
VTEEQPTVARDALYEVGVISDILIRLGGTEISGDHPIDGCFIEWLGHQIQWLSAEAPAAVEGRKPKAATPDLFPAPGTIYQPRRPSRQGRLLSDIRWIPQAARNQALQSSRNKRSFSK